MNKHKHKFLKLFDVYLCKKNKRKWLRKWTGYIMSCIKCNKIYEVKVKKKHKYIKESLPIKGVH